MASRACVAPPLEPSWCSSVQGCGPSPGQTISYVGGTSAAAPLVAGMIALWDQQAKQSGLPKPGFVPPLLYSIAQHAPGSCLDITTGSNSVFGGVSCCAATPSSTWHRGSARRSPTRSSSSYITDRRLAGWRRPRTGTRVMSVEAGVSRQFRLGPPPGLLTKRSTPNMLLGVADANPPAQDPGPQGRCVCGQKVTIADAREITLPNGRAGWEGYCPECGAPLFAIRRGSRAGASTQSTSRPSNP